MISGGIEAGDQRTATDRWRGIPRRWRVVLLIVCGVVAVELCLSLVSGVAGNSPAGNQASSSFGTSSSGIAAFAQLLSQHGHQVDRLTRPVADVSMPLDSTLFIVDPVGWTGPDTTKVAALVDSGVHVVLVGRPPSDDLLRAMFGPDPIPRWRTEPAGLARAVGSTSLVTGVAKVSSGPSGSIGPTGQSRAVLVGRQGVFGVAGATPPGDPDSVLLASSTFMTNTALADNDNAAFALNLAGPSSRLVVFDEFDHGYGRTGTGLAGLPAWWRRGLGLALLALVVWMVSAARRFGPVQPEARHLIPARVEYADALAANLASLPDGQLDGAVGPLKREARQLLCRRSGVLSAADDEEVRRAGETAGVPDHVVAAALAPTHSADDALEVGAALAWLESHKGVRT
jgi:hypothetical protein